MLPTKIGAPGAPDREAITDVMNDCDCTEERAIKLLQWAKNDPQKAKNHHQKLSAYMNRPARSSQASVETPRSSREASRSTLERTTDAISIKVSGSNTPPTDDDDTQTSPAPNRGIPPSKAQLVKQAGRERDQDKCIEISSPLELESDGTNELQNSVPRFRVPVAPSHRTLRPEQPLQPTITENFGAQSPIFEVLDGQAEEPKQEPEPEPEAEWDLVLPVVRPPPTLIPGLGNGSDDFDIYSLVGAMQHGIDFHSIQNYLAYYDQSTVESEINEDVHGFPAMFYAVATNSEPIIRAWASCGGDINAVHDASGVPLIAFTIIQSEIIQQDTTRALAALLSLGATPSPIPSAFYSPFCRDLPEHGPDLKELGDINDDDKTWCTPAARTRLARTANLTSRYYLERAAKTKKPSTRHRQIALRRNAEALLGIPYFLIGQTVAANLLLQKLLSHIMIPSKRPLVLVFAGPSGHGKTELARSLGHLLSLELEVVDCTIYSREQELFGPRAPWAEWEKGSPLNNFLARKAGERCIVFLDEFEKTSRDIHQTLLLPFDSGDYEDRRNREKIDCSKTIWILATNALDSTIKDFCAQNHDAVFISEDEVKRMQMMKQLSKSIKQEFLHIFDSPLTGRISSFLPFLPFSPSEQAVVAHKYLLELSGKVRSSVDLSTGPNERLLGNVRLRIKKDASVCGLLAASEYHADLGARSLITAVKSQVEDVLVERYLDVEREIGEGNEVVEFVVDVQGGEVVVNMVG